MPINENELTKEILAKAMKCETADDLIALGKAEGIDLTKEEAEAYLAEMDDVELDDTALQQVAGGACYADSTNNSSPPRCNGRCPSH